MSDLPIRLGRGGCAGGITPRACCGLLAALLGTALLAPPAARAFEFLDGALQVHGFGELQIRSLADDFDTADDFDVSQWYNVLNVEIEWNLVTDGWGPFDLVAAFARIEGRYDCIWSRCGFLNTTWIGDRASHLPQRVIDGRKTGYRGQLEDGDTRRLAGRLRSQLPLPFRFDPLGDNRRKPAYLWHVPGIDTLFEQEGADGIRGTPDDPPNYTFERFIPPKAGYRFGFREIPGPADGVDVQVLGPWLPKNRIRPIGVLGDRANPFRPGDLNPLTRTFGSTALPYRPAPLFSNLATPPLTEARGLYYPNPELARLVRLGRFDSFDQNFRQEELEWNHGASQQDEKELKELYLDLEFFESRLWVRVGKQSIVWGKTELFRTTDQFNPQDIALATLPTLEESRISLWSARAVWSFYEVGPLEDVRLELAANFDQFEPDDLGRCGEPYTPNPVCNKTFGLFAHGLTGLGLAGEIRPPNPWNSWKGLEAGARLEFRWDRFSFAVVDYYGYDDRPYVDQLFVYERNVDPTTGRPRRAGARGRCRTGAEPDCLQGGEDALRNHHANVQLFAMICSSSVGFSDLDPTVCAQSVFNSQQLTSGVPIALALARILAGDVAGGLGDGALILQNIGGIPLATAQQVMVGLNRDPMDCTRSAAECANIVFSLDLQDYLSDAQEALLGCGPFYGTVCGTDGIDLLNTEASALIQSWPGVSGTEGPDWDPFDASLPQPGTVGFAGGPVCTRFEGGQLVILPGCRGPADAGYDPNVDGTVAPDGFGVGFNTDDQLVQPFTGQAFQSEMAALSWNALMGLVTLSGLGQADRSPVDFFDPANPFATDKCSFRRPHLCDNVRALYSVVGIQHRTVRAAGNGLYGRPDFVWHGGSSAVLRYRKRNVVGFSMDFAEDVTKTNWSLEATWIRGLRQTDNREFDGLSEVDAWNLTISMDRPTFINFLNQDRTFFINTQIFIQYIDGYRRGFPTNGPWNLLGTLTVQTGYFQDRLLPSLTLVYDVRSSSGGALGQVGYRLTENFSVIVGYNAFFGRWQRKEGAVVPLGRLPGTRAFRGAYASFAENGLAAVRDRDELFLRIRYTF